MLNFLMYFIEIESFVDIGVFLFSFFFHRMPICIEKDVYLQNQNMLLNVFIIEIINQ